MPMPERLEARHFIAFIFWCLTLYFGLSGIEALFAFDRDGVEVILLFGNALLTLFIGTIFATPDPDYFDTLPIDKDPRIPRQPVPRRNRPERD